MTTATDRGYAKLLGTILEAEDDSFWLRWGLVPPGKKLCVGCGKLIPKKSESGSSAGSYCEECYQARHYVTLTCGQCGKEFKLSKTEYGTRLRKRKVPSFFCNKKCFGRYVGLKYGIKRKYNRDAIFRLWVETGWSGSDIARHLGIPIGSTLYVLGTYPEYVYYRLIRRKHN